MNIRIAIIGNYASGKTTFAKRLGLLLNTKVYHLDDIYFSKRRAYASFDWDKYQKALVRKDSWIIEGNFPRTWNIRTEAADQVLYFDFPVWKSLLRYLLRKFYCKTRDGVGLKELKKIIFFPRINVASRKVMVFRSNKESDMYLEKISNKRSN